MSEHLVLNLFFIIVPALTYVTLLQSNRAGRFAKPGIALLAALSLSACIVYPFRYSLDYSSNLKFIPFLIGTFYGGGPVGLFLSLVMALVHFSVWHKGLIQMFVFASLMAGLVTLARKRFHHARPGGKIGLFTLACLGLVLLEWLIFLLNRVVIPYQTVATFMIIHVVTGGLALFLIESYRDRYKIRQELDRLERLDVISQLAASIAHEVRNPLTTVKGFLQLVKHKRIPIERMEPILHSALEDIERTEMIIGNFLALARPSVEEKEQVKIGSCVKQVMDLMESYAILSRVETLVEIDETVEMFGDKNKLVQCLIHLTKNAIESMPDGGKLVVLVKETGGHKRIEIADTGIGMNKAQLAQLGTPYYSTKTQGTGLGLMFCYRFIQSINGKIEVESSVGKGTRFSIVI